MLVVELNDFSLGWGPSSLVLSVMSCSGLDPSQARRSRFANDSALAPFSASEDEALCAHPMGGEGRLANDVGTELPVPNKTLLTS